MYLPNIAKRPIMWKGVRGCCKWYTANNKQYIGHGQIEDQEVCGVTHLFVKGHNQNNQIVPEKANQTHNS